MSQITRVGVGIAKSEFHVHTVDRHGACQWQAKLKRANWIDALCEHVPVGSTIAIAYSGVRRKAIVVR